jgi:DNA invertase Pin-like site-specific DNA recombinase
MGNFFSQQRKMGRGQRLKLDADKVRLIRRRIAAGVSQRDIAKELGIGASTVGSVNSGATWGHVKDEENTHG